MRKKIVLGAALVAAAAGAALAGGVAYANDGVDLRISYEQVQGTQSGTDCPEGAGSTPEADL
jgi:hypothetical protein